jgi:ubiquinone/menaquinone biosynthesis C-methylase UbiE
LGACAQTVRVKNENKIGSSRLKMFDFDASNLRSFDHWTTVEPYFDLLISSGVIHYEDSKENYIKALNEYHRVLKKNGVILVLTSGSKNDLRRNAKLMSKCLYKVSINDFRKKKLFYFMNNKRDIISHYSPFFKNIEIGSCSEFFLDKIYDAFIILGKKL